MTTERRLPDLVSAFTEFANIFNAPARWITWGALYMVASSVTRQVAMRAHGNVLHPNLFIMLAGPPSAGKSQTIKPIRSILTRATDFSFIPASTTRAGLEDYMQANVKNRVNPDGSFNLSSECIGLSDELQGILPDQDLGHLTLYNILFDCPDLHRAITRSNGEITLESPYCSLFTGCQPSFLALTLPEQAWGMGFMARTVMVWDRPKKRKSAFRDVQPNLKLFADIVHDVNLLSNLHGTMKWEPAAERLYEEWWVNNNGHPIPQSKRLAMGYNGRRELNFFKLAMAYSLSQSNDLVVTGAHAASALSLLLDAENEMKHIFNEMAGTGSFVAIEDMLDMIKNDSAAGRHTTESAVINHLMQRFPATQIHSIIENLVTSGTIIVQDSALNAKGFRHFKIGTKAGL